MTQKANQLSFFFEFLKQNALDVLSKERIVNHTAQSMRTIKNTYVETKINPFDYISIDKKIELLKNLSSALTLIKEEDEFSSKIKAFSFRLLSYFNEEEKPNAFNDLVNTFHKWFDKNVELSDWIVIDDYCATRVIKGSDPDIESNRIAFIEKTPRIRIANSDDRKGWFYGHGGSGGSNGHIPENEIYGFDPESRQWCDEHLKLLGYIF